MKNEAIVIAAGLATGIALLWWWGSRVEPGSDEDFQRCKKRMMAPPAGYHYYTDPQVAQVAGGLLGKLPEGVSVQIEVDGMATLFRAEPHFHSQASGLKPVGCHKGISAYRA